MMSASKFKLILALLCVIGSVISAPVQANSLDGRISVTGYQLVSSGPSGNGFVNDSYRVTFANSGLPVFGF